MSATSARIAARSWTPPRDGGSAAPTTRPRPFVSPSRPRSSRRLPAFAGRAAAGQPGFRPAHDRPGTGRNVRALRCQGAGRSDRSARTACRARAEAGAAIPPAPSPRLGSPAERSPSGLWRRTGNAVRGNPSRVRIPPSPPHACCRRSVSHTVPRRRGRRPAATGLIAFCRALDDRHSRPRRSASSRSAPDDPWPGQAGLVVAYAVRHGGGVFLFDTGFAPPEPELDEFYARYRVQGGRCSRRWPTPASPSTRSPPSRTATSISTTAARTPCSPTCRSTSSRPSGRSRTSPTTPSRATLDFPGARYVQVDGDHEPAPGIRVFATPGHSPGHQSLVVETPDGPLLLAGQAVYSHGEWTGIEGARDGSITAPDRPAYLRSVASPARAQPEAGPVRPRSSRLAVTRRGILGGPC